MLPRAIWAPLGVMSWRKSIKKGLFGARTFFQKSLGSDRVPHGTPQNVKKMLHTENNTKMCPKGPPNETQMAPKGP